MTPTQILLIGLTVSVLFIVVGVLFVRAGSRKRRQAERRTGR